MRPHVIIGVFGVRMVTAMTVGTPFIRVFRTLVAYIPYVPEVLSKIMNLDVAN